MTRPGWDNLLEELRAVHANHADLSAFCPFPSDVFHKEATPHFDPLCQAMQDSALIPTSEHMRPLRDAFAGAAYTGVWRETYMDTEFGPTLHASFGCFETLGDQTPLGTEQMRSFVIYQKPGFYYPMHHHPAEELYLVVAGEGEFHQEGEESRLLGPGATTYHASNVPHALTTHEHPIIAYVLWRGDLRTKPVWTYPEELA
ncbi:MAG: dimethylsulfonioproprionate lyase family protein [Pseudomonadota bacterium]